MKTKIFYLIMFITTINITAFCQCELLTAQKTIGSSGDDFLGDMDSTRDGGWIVGGSSNSPIAREKSQGSRGGFDYWVVKLRPDMAKPDYKQWDKTFGGSGDDRLFSIQQTADGGYILGGRSNSNISGEKTQNSRGGYDYWIVKLDNNGNKVWDKTFGGSGTEELFALQQTREGGYILGGYSNSNISGEKTENRRGETDYWVVKLNNNGNKEWDRTIGGNNHDQLSVLQEIQGGYILGGYSTSGISGEKTESNRGGTDYWVVKLDITGTRCGIKPLAEVVMTGSHPFNKMRGVHIL